MIEFEILYANLTRERHDVTDAAVLDAAPHDGALAVLLSAPFEGAPRRVQFLEQLDNYLVAINPTEQLAYLGGWDDNEGGWFRLSNPFATDGYQKATVPPYLIPYCPGAWRFWVFRGVQVPADVWQKSEATRREMR